MYNKKLSQRYAKPLFQIGVKYGGQEEIYKNMFFLLSICDNEIAFNDLLQNPIIKSETKKNVLVKIFGSLLNKHTQNFIFFLLNNKKEFLLCDIAKAYIDIYNDHLGIKTAYLATAYALSNDILEKIKEKAKKLVNCKQVILKNKIDKNLIGGFILQIDDIQIDTSFKSKLNLIKDVL